MTGRKVSSFRDRLSELVASSGKSQSSIAADFGIAKQTLSAWLTGQNSPRSPIIQALSDYFGVSLPWLMGFDVPRIVSSAERESLYSEAEQHLISVWRDSDESAKKYALQILESSADENRKKKAESSSGQTA